MGQKHKHTRTHKCISLCQVRLGAAVVLGMFVGWLLRKGKRAKGTCWHNAFTNNCLLLLVPQGEHFMEMAVYEGQRCEKATGKISFLDSPTCPASFIPCLPVMQMHKIKVDYKKTKT